MRSPPDHATLAALLAVGITGCSSGYKSAWVEVPGTSPGSEYTCGAPSSPDGTGPSAVNCHPGGDSVPADDNRSSTWFVNLPQECSGKVSRVVIRDLDSKAPTAHVYCAQPANPITEAPH